MVFLFPNIGFQVGIVGTTGCGKSSFLLVLLRVLEPRGGRVLLNAVDTRDIGLATLREAMGLVPQERKSRELGPWGWRWLEVFDDF